MRETPDVTSVNPPLALVVELTLYVKVLQHPGTEHVNALKKNKLVLASASAIEWMSLAEFYGLLKTVPEAIVGVIITELEHLTVYSNRL